MSSARPHPQFTQQVSQFYFLLRPPAPPQPRINSPYTHATIAYLTTHAVEVIWRFMPPFHRAIYIQLLTQRLKFPTRTHPPTPPPSFSFLLLSLLSSFQSSNFRESCTFLLLSSSYLSSIEKNVTKYEAGISGGRTQYRGEYANITRETECKEIASS